MEDKKTMIENYIRNISAQLNSQYKGIMDEDKIKRAIEMFGNSTEQYEEVIKKINELAQVTVNNYVEEMRKRFDPEMIKSNHKEIYDKLEMLVEKLNSYGIDYQLAGALCSYIKYGVESSRTHDDIDISLNEADMDKFRRVCEEMGLNFADNRLTSPRVLKRGIPSGEHEVIATLDGSDFHIGAFCFERQPDGSVINKGYYHDENNMPCSRNDIMSPELASLIFGREVVNFRGHQLCITPPEYIYKLKSYTQNQKDQVDLEFMRSRIDQDKLSRINLLSANSKTELVRVSELPKLNSDTITNVQTFNYHTHTYRSGHGEYCSDREIVETAKQNGIKALGFSEHIPNPNFMLPSENERMLLSEVEEYISSISQIKRENPDMIILSGFEAEFDPMKESFLGEMRNKVDYMVLGQHFVTRGLQVVDPNNNPNYPIEYANMICDAIDSGIFDIVAHPDIFMQYRDTMLDENSKKLFDENSVLASQVICEKARDMGIPLEINFGGLEKNMKFNDGNLSYPHPTFWEVAKEIDGLQVIQGIDSHDLSSINNYKQSSQNISSISNFVSDKLLQDFNPVVARANNQKLQNAYNVGQENALTYESHMVNTILDSISTNIPDGTTINDVVSQFGYGLNSMMQKCVDNASMKDKGIIEEISTIGSNEQLSTRDKKGMLERKKKTIDETNQVLTNQQSTIETAKRSVMASVEMGCESKEEIVNISTQLTEYSTTKNDSHKTQIGTQMAEFQQTQSNESGLGQNKGWSYTLRPNGAPTSHVDSGEHNGFTNVLSLSLIVTFACGVIFGITYMLLKMWMG